MVRKPIFTLVQILAQPDRDTRAFMLTVNCLAAENFPCDLNVTLPPKTGPSEMRV